MADTRLIVPTITMEMGKARLQREEKKRNWKVHGMCDCCFYLWTRFSPLAAPILRH
ncbi:hypothetical protein V6Z11_D01G007600 [Gossypium hirsutum]